MKKLLVILLLSFAFCVPVFGAEVTSLGPTAVFPVWKGSASLTDWITFQNFKKSTSPYIDVRYYGATGDGTTDDTAAIGVAQAAAGTTKELYFSPGTYITTGLTISSAQTWRLDSKATIKLRANTGSTPRLLTIAASGVKVSGGTFDGNSANQGSNSDSTIKIASGYADVLIDGVHVKDTKGASNIAAVGPDTYRVHIKNNILEGGGGGAIVVGYGIYDSEIKDNYILSTSGDTNGISVLSGAYRTVVSGNSISNLTRQAIEVWTDANDTLIANNTISLPSTADCGISAAAAIRSIISGNHIKIAGDNSTGMGIEIAGSDRCSVIGNQIVGAGNPIVVDVSSYGIYEGNVIKGVFSTNPIPAGIGIVASTAANADYNVISNNQISFAGDKLGVAIQCNHGSADCSYNRIIGNTIIGSVNNLGKGIWPERDAGVMLGTYVSGNVFKTLYAGVNINNSGTYSEFYNNQFVDVSFQFAGNVDNTNLYSSLIYDVGTPPGSSATTCTAGQFWFDDNYTYVCTQTNVLKRSGTLSTW